MFKILGLVITLLAVQSAHAIFEARLTYGLLGSKPDLASLYTDTSSTSLPTVSANTGIGADALVILPIVGLGAGLRYENLGFTASSNGIEYKSQITRTALVVNYRLINTLIFIGPIATYGISHSNSIKWADSNSGSSAEFTPDTATSYSVGLEAGVKLVGFILGAEAGYQNLKWNKLVDSKNTITATPDLDMSGSYVKVILGFGI